MNLIKVYLLILTGIFSISLKPDSVGFRYEILAEDLNRPWGIAIVDNDHVIFTELSGQLRQIKEDKLVEEPVKGVPSVLFKGQGGLSGVTVDPDFKSNNIIYLAFSSRDEGKRTNTLKVIRAELIDNSLKNIKEIFSAFPSRNTALHYGAKMAFLDDGTLLITCGDGFNYRESAQKLDNHFGKILRINTDGSIPDDNPFLDLSYALPEIWSYGHRNPQGLINHDGVIYGLEHGPMGGDEINVIEPGNNYGWPVISYGINYDSTIFTDLTKKEGMEQPLYYWVPSIAPSCFEYLDSDNYGDWKGSLLVGSLNYGYLERLTLNVFGKVNYREKIAPGVGRVRDVKVSPSGFIHIAVEKDGIYKIVPQ